MRDFHTFVSIADIHIGRESIPASEMKAQLKEHFFKVIKQFRYLDGIFICGDILHTIISLNSDNSEVFYWFIDQVYKIARKKNSTVIIVKGTQSHEHSQLNNIKHYQMNDDGVDFRVYDTVEEITIWGNYKVLVLPDLKVKKLKDIDERLELPNQYDLILGHGTIDAMQFFVQESEHFSYKTYLFDVDKLSRACRGPILFGHIHQYQRIQKQFYYVGSFTTLERGTTSAGYLVGAIYDQDRSKFVINRYLNPDSAKFYELTVTKELLSEYHIDDIMEELDEMLAEMKPNDLVTLRIVRGDERDSADKVLMLEERYRKDPRISIVKKVKTDKEEEIERQNQFLRDRYSYAWDTGLEMHEIMWRYYQEDVLPKLEEGSPLKTLTEDDFKRVLLKEKHHNS